jgi:hypothetical protein
LRFDFCSDTSSLFATFVGNASELETLAQVRQFAALPSATRPEVQSWGWMEAVAALGGCGTPAGCATQAHSYPNPSQPLRFAAMSIFANRTLSSLAAASAALQHCASRMPGFGVLLLDAYGGAINRVNRNDSAFAHRRMVYHIQVMGYMQHESELAGTQRWLNDTLSTMQAFTPRASYRNYPSILLAEPNQRYFDTNLPRLISIKQKIDPHNAFAYQQSIFQ